MDDSIIAALLNDFPLVLPEIVLVVFAGVLFLGGAVRPNRHLWAAVALLGVVVAGLFALPNPKPADAQVALFASPLLGDSLARFVRLISLGGGVLLILLSWNEVPDRQAGDYHGCLLIVLAGLSLTGFADDLVALFLALEMVSIPTYVMLYLPRHDSLAQEAALKYFMLSIFSSALLLFGFSYLYGLTGSTNLAVLLHTLHGLGPAGTAPYLAQVAVILVVAGLGFRISVVPFHFYAPDVYQGTATVMAAFLAFVPKVAGFAALLRVLGFVLPAEIPHHNVLIGTALSNQTPILLWFLAAVTMTLGNILALLQTDLKRLLAYSSIAHAGYMLIGLASAPYLRSAGADAIAALLYYLVAYVVMTLGAFAVIAFLHRPSRPVAAIDDLAGLSRTHLWAAVLMTVFLFSLIGIPFTAGFTGKLLIFFGAVGVDSPSAAGAENSMSLVFLYRLLAFIGVLNAAIGAWYYLKIIAAMFLRTAIKPVDRPATVPGFAAIVLCAVLTIGLSIPPGSTWLLGRVQRARGTPPAPAPAVQQAQR
jgi:NADH-quinone oxidoreductase subunit N